LLDSVGIDSRIGFVACDSGSSGVVSRIIPILYPELVNIAMKSLHPKIRLSISIGLFIMVTGLFVGLRIVELHRNGFIGIDLILQADGAVISHVHDNSPAARDGIRPGDRVLAINDIPIEECESITALRRQVHVGDTVQYRILRKSQEFTIPIRIAESITLRRVLTSLALSIPIAMIYLILGSLVFRRRPDDRRARVILWVTLSAAFFFIVQSVALFGNDVPFGQSAAQRYGDIYLFFASACLFLTLLLHLALLFPKPRPAVVNHPILLRLIYLPTIFSVFGFIIIAFRPVLAIPRPLRIVSSLSSFGSLLVSMLFIIPMGVTMYRSYRDSNFDERVQLRWLLWGAMVNLGGIAALLLLAVSWWHFYGWGPFIGIAMLCFGYGLFLIIPFSFAMAIFKYQRIQIDRIIKHTIVYAVVIGLIIIAYILLLRFL